MLKKTFDEGIRLISSRLGTPAPADRIRAWTDATYKALKFLSDQQFEAVAQAAFEELEFWNQFSAKWCRDKLRDLRPGDPVALPPAHEPPPSPMAFPVHVKAWLYASRIRWLRMSEAQRTAALRDRFVHPGRSTLPDDVAQDLAAFRKAVEDGAKLPQIENPLGLAILTVDSPLF